MAEGLSFGILGPLEVWRDGTEVAVGAAKQRSLLAVLLLNRSGVSRDALIDALWGERPPAGARNTLQAYVSSLRRALGREAIDTTPHGYRLQLEPDALDAARFERLLDSGREALASENAGLAAETLAEALALWRGPALADFRYEAFAQAEAGRLDELRLACVEERLEAELQLGRHAGLVGELEALVVEHPLRERLRGQLILALYRSGRQSEALAQYQAARRMLADELGLEPSPELRELERMILAHDPGLAAPPSPAEPLSNLPLQPTPFIGREHELADLLELIRGGGRRLVTLTGPGGSGKTRLAIEAASRMAGDYPDGVWWAPLQSLQDPQLVLPSIAAAIEAKGGLASHIRDKRMLILTDNFEHLLDAAPEVGALFGSCPNLFLLATSREPLHLAGERDCHVAPMFEPEAVALFQERAYRDGEYELVAEICRRLDCLPLAIELAAARTKAFTHEQILEQLEQRLPMLAGGPRDAPHRQQALRATIEWSYDLLSGRSRRLFARFSVFSGGCALDAARDVCRTDLDGLQALADSSLLNSVGGRYSMLDTIREYAHEQLQERGEADSLHEAHAGWFLKLALQVWDDVGGPPAATVEVTQHWLPIIEADLDNLRAAIAWLIDGENKEDALYLIVGLSVVWVRGGHFDDEAVRWLRQALDAPGSAPQWNVLNALGMLGTFLALMGRPSEAEPVLEEALQIARSLDEPGPIVLQLRCLALAAQLGGDLVRARRLLEEAVTIPLDEPITANMALGDLGTVELGAGNLTRAQELLERALGNAQAHDLPRVAAMYLPRLGDVELLRRSFDTAETRYLEGLEIASSVSWERMIWPNLGGLAAVAAARGELERAGCVWGATQKNLEEYGAIMLPPGREICGALLDGRAEPQFLRGLERGQELSLDALVAYALGKGVAGGCRRADPSDADEGAGNPGGDADATLKPSRAHRG